MDDFWCFLFHHNCEGSNPSNPYIEQPDYGAAPIPEPNSVILAITGALVIGYFLRR